MGKVINYNDPMGELTEKNVVCGLNNRETKMFKKLYEWYLYDIKKKK